MTRGQIRAQMRRLREQNEEADEEKGEINLVPYMDIVTNIIIFLLASVVHSVALANINVASPKIGGDPGDVTQKPPDPTVPELNLTVTVGATGFTVAASGGVLPGPDGQFPTIRKLPDGKYDFGALSKKLREIKDNPGNAAQNETKANFNADADVAYGLVVETLDAMRTDEKGGTLFPDINFAAGII